MPARNARWTPTPARYPLPRRQGPSQPPVIPPTRGARRRMHRNTLWRLARLVEKPVAVLLACDPATLNAHASHVILGRHAARTGDARRLARKAARLWGTL